MTGRFEWHITVDKEHRHRTELIANRFNWVFSEITGCPILGHGTYCYITGFDTDFDKAKEDMGYVSEELKAWDVIPLREKIENIVYDTKTKVGISELTK